MDLIEAFKFLLIFIPLRMAANRGLAGSGAD
jgi:hypothetical protein